MSLFLKEKKKVLSKDVYKGGAWLAQSEEHPTLDLRVVSSSSVLGVEIT